MLARPGHTSIRLQVAVGAGVVAGAGAVVAVTVNVAIAIFFFWPANVAVIQSVSLSVHGAVNHNPFWAAVAYKSNSLSFRQDLWQQ